jgi:general nucleoside transport system permease protein
MSMQALDILFTASLWAAAVRIASPLIFAALGELICERAGVLNLGIEGIMTVGAFSGWLTVYMGGGLWLGVCVAALTGAAFGLLHAVLVVPLGLSQHVTGIGITLLASSLSYYIYRLALPEVTSPPKIEPFASWRVPGLADIPFFGEAVFQQTPLTYLAFVLVLMAWWFLYRTPAGLAVRMAGETPAAVEAQGIDVTRVRMGAVVAGSALMGIGGSFLTLSAFNSFFFEMINGRGWICIALVVFGSWRPGKVLLGALLFGLFDAYQLRLQQLAGSVVPYQVFLMLPYFLSIIALIVMSRKASYPRALMVPYRKGER